MIKRVGKRGDTLIEVMLAVGIFSMVAVAVVAVMSGGTSSAQTALETTLAREEIDAQAEALRFIQASYIADKNGGEESKYSELWKTITGNAIDIEGMSEEEIELIVQYSPPSCADLYSTADANNIATQKAFALNTRNLSSSDIDTIYYSAANNNISTENSTDKTFIPASTYPHLIFGDSNGILSNGNFNNTLQKAEGIYIIAVKDPKSTTVAGSDSIDGRESAYYDFYIRTCWYGTGDQTPSTISTVMRLYDPDAIKEIKPQTSPSEPSESEETPSTPETEPENPSNPSTPSGVADIKDSPYAISRSGTFAYIGNYSAEKNNNLPALVGFLCYQSGSNRRIVPVLVSDKGPAATYEPGSESSIRGDFTYKGKQYYYFGGWTVSPYAKADCTESNSNTNKSIITKGTSHYETFLYNYIEGVSAGSSATRETARALVESLSK